MRKLRNVVMGVVVLLELFGLPTAASGQSPAPAGKRRGDVSIGMASVHDSGFVDRSLHLTAAWRPWKSVGWVVDVLARGRPESDLMGGVRIQGDRAVSPYVQLLVSPLLALQPGVGADVRITRRINVRAGVDYWFTEEDGYPLKRTRFTAGVAYLFW
jgi:hypothetical protein